VVSYSGIAGAAIRVIVERADGAKCERCWKYVTTVGSDAQFPTVCDACSAALREMGVEGGG
jgi:isoleucyl-tRNA synthetase